MSKLRKEKGIVLRSFKYGETSLILDILTENFGLKSFIIQSVRKAKSRTSPSSVQLMAAVDIDFYLKEDTELFQLKEIRSNRLWISIYSDMRKIAMSMYMAEVTRKVVNKYENHSEIYDLLSVSLEMLENSHHAWSLHFGTLSI
ncbi:MAG: DNA repair protein RecO [Saprospiraceae bacterium]|nr:DNA repair protein RecO [Candidatus Brachybacter algidus]